MKTFKNILDFMSFFSSEKKCYEFFKLNIWKEGAFCPHCGSNEVYEYASNFKKNRCKDCKCDFSIRKGTIFEESRMSLQKWFMCIYLMNSNKKGISSLSLSRQVGITQKTAWFVLQRLRHVASSGMGSMFGGTNEIDETYVGGKEGNKHKHKKGLEEKAVVLGIKNRDSGKVKAFHIETNTYCDMAEKIFEKVEHGSTLITNEYKGYKALKYYYNHESINHSKKEYVRKDVSSVAVKITTNGVEGVFSQLKRGINGIYHWASKKHLQRYLNEFEFRFNTRELADNLRFSEFLNNVQGRLTYKNLIKGV